MGLEPMTFCMARTGSSATRAANPVSAEPAGKRFVQERHHRHPLHARARSGNSHQSIGFRQLGDSAVRAERAHVRVDHLAVV